MTCNDGDDNDCDGLTDCDDPDCQVCSVSTRFPLSTRLMAEQRAKEAVLGTAFEKLETKISDLVNTPAMLEMAEKRWRRINGAHLIPLVRAGVGFSDGARPKLFAKDSAEPGPNQCSVFPGLNIEH